MEPFQLICQSCAAKLKVKNPSAIGQRLACPKCRQMILVEAPEGYGDLHSTGPTTSFENMDLDSILENRPAEPKKPQKTKRPKPPTPKPRKTKPTAEIILTPRRSTQAPKPEPKPVGESTDATAPTINPTEDWVNPATKKKQRLVLIVMGIVGGLLVLTAAIVATISLSSDKPQPSVAIGDDGSITDTSKEPEDTDAEVTATETVEQNSDPIPDDVPLDQNPLDDDISPLITDEPPPIIVSDVPPSVETDMDDVKDDLDSTFDAAEANDPPPDDANAVEEPNPESEKLRQILEESGTSLLALRGAAANVRSLEFVGTPKYYFEKSAIPEINFNRAKDQILLGVSYDDQPLQTVLQELSAISGLSLAIDVPAITAKTLYLNPKVTLKLTDQSTANIVRAVAKSVDLVAVETDSGFWISSPPSSELKQIAFDVGKFINNEADGSRLVQIVQRSVYPDAWQDNASNGGDNTGGIKGKIQFADGTLSVNHVDTVIREVERVMKAIEGLDNGATDGPLFQPVPSLDSGKFSTPFGSKNSIRVPLSSFIQTISENSGVRVIIDWQSLRQAGWTPSSLAPGMIDEPTVGDVIRETSHGMGVSIYLVDDATAWLTAPPIAANIFELKIYPIDSLAAGKLSPARLAQILRKAIGEQLFRPGVAIELLPGGKHAIVRGPQSLHYQIAAILSELAKPGE